MLKVTKSHSDILYLLYRFRFLTRLNIQLLQHQKQPTRIKQRLQFLLSHDLIQSFTHYHHGAATPLYALTKGGMRYLKNHPQDYKTKERIRKQIYSLPTRSREFRAQCQKNVETYFVLTAMAKTQGKTLSFYTQVDLSGISPLPSPLPHAYYKSEKEGVSKRYFVEIFPKTLPVFALQRRLEQYFHFWQSSCWREATDTDSPSLLCIAPDTATKGRINNYLATMKPEFFNCCFILVLEE